METGWAILVLGFMLGLKHALDADHVVAVSAIVSENKNLRKSSLLGVFWGFGHTLTLLLVGLVVLVFKISIPENVALSLEFLVGVVLVVLGLTVLKKVHLHFHRHEEEKHIHIHSHKHENSHSHEHRSFAVGVVHGLAGSGALMLLILATIDTVWQGIFYILVFGLGSILGMLLISTVIGLPFAATANFEKLNMRIRVVAGIISILLGIAIIIEIGLVEGLFYHYF